MDTERWIENTGERRVRKPTSVVRRRAGGEGLCKQYLACCLSYFCLGFAGSKAEAEQIKHDLSQFLQDILKLELSEEKTLITHATTERAHFLGYELVIQYVQDKLDRHGRRCVNGKIALRVPAQVIQEKCMLYQRRGKPRRRGELMLDSDYSIISRYQAEYRGFVQYYQLAQNVSWLWNLHRVMRVSLLKTLAGKHKSSVGKMIRKYHTTITTPQGEYVCLEVKVERKGKPPLVARFGGIPLHRQTHANLIDLPTSITRRPERNELLKRLLADRCELCQSTEHIEVHHIRKLADLKQGGWNEKPSWVKVMAARQRKTLVVCRTCHDAIHAGRPTPIPKRT
jgi:hypothetical protein